MTSFGMAMLWEGVDVEFSADLDSVIGMLDQEIPWFTCDGYGYCLTSAKGTVGSSWEVLIKLANPVTREALPPTLGRVILEKADSGLMRLRVPSRSEEQQSDPNEFDEDGRFYGSFVSQVLNTCQRHNLIELPGILPTF